MPGIVDPVCGKEVDALRARAIGIFGGTTYYFCSAECKARFADPRRAERATEAPARVAPTPPPKPTPIVAPAITKPASAPVIVEAPAIEAPPLVEARRSPMWMIAILALAIAGALGVFVTRSRPPEPTSVVAPVAPTPPSVAEIPPTPVVAPPPNPAVAQPPSPAVDATQPLRVGLRWFVTDRDDGATLVERLLVIDGAEHATLYDIGHVDLHANVATRDGSAPLVVKEPFTSSTAEPGIIYEDSFAAGNVGLDVRVERTAEGVVASERAHGATTWKHTVTIPLAADAKLRGAPFGKKRYEEAATQKE